MSQTPKSHIAGLPVTVNKKDAQKGKQKVKTKTAGMPVTVKIKKITNTEQTQLTFKAGNTDQRVNKVQKDKGETDKETKEKRINKNYIGISQTTHLNTNKQKKHKLLRNNKHATRFIQINLKKKINANKTMLSEIKKNDIIIIQEPYINTKGIIPDVPRSHKTYIYIKRTGEHRRAAILVPTELAKSTIMLNGLSNKDAVSIRCDINKNTKLLITSIYMDKEKAVPTELIEKISKFANDKKLALVMGTDTNAHSTTWGCTQKQDNICKRAPVLIETINNNNLIIENQPEINIPTFDSPIGRSNIDLTITNEKANKLIMNWDIKINNVSDHNTLVFEMNAGNIQISKYRDIKDCDWKIFKEEMDKMTLKKEKLYPITNKISLDNKMENITNQLVKAYEIACPEKERIFKTTIPWWNKELTKIKNETKKQRKKATITRTKDDWEKYKENDKKYNQEISKAKKTSWKKYCNETYKMKDLAKIPKTNNKHNEQLNCLETTNGKITTSPEETLKTLADTLFETKEKKETIEKIDIEDKKETENVITKILNKTKIQNIVKELKQRKTPGEDKISNEIIQQAWTHIEDRIIHIFKHSLELNHIPKPWRLNKGVIIPKPYKDNYTNPRAFRVISLTSNFQKILEKAILNHLEDECKIDTKLTKNQYGFRKNKSTETAIHKLTRKIENAITNNQYAIGIFLDIEGAFDNIKFSSIKKL